MPKLALTFSLALFTASSVLAAQPGANQPPPALDFVISDRDGKVVNLGPAPTGAYSPRVSPDGKQLVVDAIGGVWIADLDNVSAARVLVAGQAQWPYWSPDGKSVLYTRDSDGQQALFRHLPGSADPDSLVIRPARAAESWSPQHDVLSYIELASAGDYGIWAHSFKDNQKRLLANMAPSAENSSQFSPDGSMLVYASNATGRFELYLQRYPDGEPVRITTDGGHHPVWSPDGKELLFDRDNRDFFAVTVNGLAVGEPRPVHIKGFVQTPLRRQFDMMPDGRILYLAPRQHVH